MQSSRSHPRPARAVAIAAAALAGVAALVLIGVGGSGPGLGGPAPAAAALRSFDSCEAILGYAREHRRAARQTGAYPIAFTDFALERTTGAVAAPVSQSAVTDSTAPAPSATGTNVQEAGVDEPDIVKSDGETIFALDGERLNAVAAGEDTPRLLGDIAIGGRDSAVSGSRSARVSTAMGGESELLLAGERAYVLRSGYTRDYRPITIVAEIDVANPAAMSVVRTLEVQGAYVSARQSGSVARLVVAASPRYPLGDHDGDGPATGATGPTGPAGADPETGQPGWMPTATLTDAGSGSSEQLPLVDCDSVARPASFSGTGLLSVLTLDLDAGLPAIDADAVMTSGQTVYASTDSLYVATERWRWGASEASSVATTDIHRFDASEPGVTEYASSGRVEGSMLDQFSIDEHDGVLRVASTREPAFGAAGEQSESFVTTLVEDGDALVRAGRVGGLGAGESVYAVRFAGDAAYVVTFRQVDPLYALDLSDPADPRTLGELKLRGFSSYLHPISSGLLLGVGQAADGQGTTRGSQLVGFDVSDPRSPQIAGRLAIGRGSYSEVEGDHRAFMFAADRGLGVMPVDGWRRNSPRGALAFTVGTAGEPVKERLLGAGGGHVRRSLLLGDSLFLVTDRGVTVHDAGTLEAEGHVDFQAPLSRPLPSSREG